MECVKICHFKTFRAGNFAFRTFPCFFLHYVVVKKFICEDISAEYNYKFKSDKFKGGTHPLKFNNLDPLPTRPRSHRYILFYMFAMQSVKISRFKTFLMRSFAR